WTYVSPSAPFWLGAATATAAGALLAARALRREVSPRAARATLAGLVVAVAAVAAVEHCNLGDVFRHRGATEVPVPAPRPCTPLGPARVRPSLPSGFPTLPGVVFTGNDGAGSTRGYLDRGIRATRDAYRTSLLAAGYRITHAELDPWD